MAGMAEAMETTLLHLHKDVMDRLEHFIKLRKIPNIIFHGNSGCGKNTILSTFLGKIYQENQTIMKNYTMTVNCAHGRGIRFIREELKFFAKTNVDLMDGELFKSIILLNADKLTIDAQSALRRCIELFCHSTRFFIVIDDKNKLLKPILSRFCDIYISDADAIATTTATTTNLHRYKLDKALGFNNIERRAAARCTKLKNLLLADNKKPTYLTLLKLAEDLYELSYSALDLIALVESEPASSEDDDANLKKYELLIAFSRVKKEAFTKR